MKLKSILCLSLTLFASQATWAGICSVEVNNQLQYRLRIPGVKVTQPTSLQTRLVEKYKRNVELGRCTGLASRSCELKADGVHLKLFFDGQSKATFTSEYFSNARATLKGLVDNGICRDTGASQSAPQQQMAEAPAATGAT